MKEGPALILRRPLISDYPESVYSVRQFFCFKDNLNYFLFYRLFNLSPIVCLLSRKQYLRRDLFDLQRKQTGDCKSEHDQPDTCSRDKSDGNGKRTFYNTDPA